MTKISKKLAYPIKEPVRKDYFVGTDIENNGKTVNFDFESVAKIVGGINGTSALSYRFRTDYNIDLAVLTGGVFLSAENETTVSSISKLYINKEDFYEIDLAELFRFIALNRESFVMKLRNSSNLNNAVYFKITGATEYETHFTLDVAIDINNASLLELINYNVYFFDFELSSSDLAITLPEFNKIITETGFTSTETEITFNPLWVWLIKNVSYSNTTSVTKTTTPTTLGSKRIDVFVLNSSNTFQTISGAETTGSPVKPTIPLDTLEVTFCIVGDGGIETVEPINIIDYATIVYVDSKDVLKVDKVSGYSLTKNDLTDLLKTTYDNAVNWISVNGSNLLNHILRTDNPHNVTATQVGAPSGSGTSTGTNTGDQDLSTKVDKVTGKSLISDTEITRLAGVSNTDVSGKEDVTNKSQTLPASSTLYPSNNAVINAIATADSGNVKITGSQNITGNKTFSGGSSPISRVFGIINQGFGATALGLFNSANNTNSFIRAYDVSGDIVFDLSPTGATKATSFVNSIAPASNILLADGSTIAQSSISVDVSGKVDKVAGERLINASEITKLSQQSGTNTGDETLSTIKTKLGITTLSGNNTGDQDLSVKVDKVSGKSLISDTEITRLLGVSNVDISGKENTITAGTTAQYYRGDKTMQTLNSTAVGLGNVNNTTDLLKPVSTATQTALDLKANLASPTFTGVPLVPTATAGTNTLQAASTAFVLANTNANGVIEFNTTDRTVWNNGKGNISTNTSFGDSSLRNNTSGDFNTAYGVGAMLNNTAGFNNSAIGEGSLGGNTTGLQNSAIGRSALRNNTTGSNNVGFGLEAGSFIADNVTQNIITNNSIFIGVGTKSLANNQTNQIVIGDGTTGAGSNSVTLGNTSITNTILRGAVTTNGSFVNSSAPATNALLANGTTLANPISGTGTTGYLPKFTSAGIIGNSQVFDNGTNIGIGTNNPVSAKLQLASVSTTIPTAYIYNSNSGAGESRGLYVEGGTNSTDYSFVAAKSNGAKILEASGNGVVLINNATNNSVDSLIISGSVLATQYKLSALNTAPASATATGTTGEIKITAGFIYVCTATNTWVRTALATW